LRALRLDTLAESVTGDLSGVASDLTDKVRVLVLSNFYPPAAIGGMERSCESAVKELERRGHTMLVLTSRHQRKKCPQTPGVKRLLHLEMALTSFRPALDSFLLHTIHVKRNREVLRETIQTFAPDVVFVWGMWNLPRILAIDAEKMMEGRVLYRFADYWPTLPSQLEEYWSQPGRFRVTRVIRRLLRPLALKIENSAGRAEPSLPHTVFASRAIRDEFERLGVRFSGGTIIHNAFDLSPFTKTDLSVKHSTISARRLLYVGRLAPEKGVHVAVEALGKLLATEPHEDWMLTVAGTGPTDYVEEIASLGRRLGISDRVNLIGEIPFAKVPGLYQEHSIVLFPSLWVEPFGRSVLEGMASGCTVVASRIGAPTEIIDEPATGFLFPPGDPSALADCLSRLVRDPKTLQSVGSAAQKRAVQMFRQEVVVDRLEAALEEACLAGSRTRTTQFTV